MSIHAIFWNLNDLKITLLFALSLSPVYYSPYTQAGTKSWMLPFVFYQVSRPGFPQYHHIDPQTGKSKPTNISLLLLVRFGARLWIHFPQREPKPRNWLLWITLLGWIFKIAKHGYYRPWIGMHNPPISYSVLITKAEPSTKKCSKRSFTANAFKNCVHFRNRSAFLHNTSQSSLPPAAWKCTQRTWEFYSPSRKILQNSLPSSNLEQS